MTRRRVYVETTIPSFYFDRRRSASIVARRAWTRQWWRIAEPSENLVTSTAVLEELSRGRGPEQPERLELARGLELVPIEPEITAITEALIRERVMPSDPTGDALHLAIATHHRCKFLVTWNCRHLANANKFGHIERVLRRLGLPAPTLATPLEMLGDDDETPAG